MKNHFFTCMMLFLLVNLSAVKAQVDPDTTERAGIDRFSMEAGHLFVRDSSNGLPSPNEPIDFDQGPFITDGFGPNGELISYYNFDVQPTEPAPIYVLFRGEESMPVAGQLNIVDDVPGDSDYNDFWRVIKVTVPANYVANTVTSLDQITMAAYPVDTTDMIVNCPVVPEGSTAKLRYSQQEDTGLTMGWYKGKVIFYFNFSEKALSVDGQGMVPLSPIYVSFNINPGEDGGGPPSGFKTDATGRAHNVAASLPEDEGYSPFWLVNIYDNADFDNVYDLTSAQAANLLVANAANVNCPIVSVAVQKDPNTADKESIDRFSMEAGHLFVRDSENGLPGPNEAIDFDQGEPFMTKGLGPNGELVAYYNFDVQPTEPAPIFVLFRDGESMPVADQLNIVDDIPGDSDYNDFWRVIKVTVPADYVANTITSLDEITMAGYTVDTMDVLVNCPIVPKGSTAKYRMGGEGPGLTRGWYRGKVIYYFNFAEKALSVDAQDMVSLSPIYVAFNINPPEGGPSSGFKTEEATGRAHNVVATLPADEGYSPLWRVNVYDNADFDNVHDLASAQSANILAMGVANVNCPIVLMYEKIDRFSMDAGNLFVRDSSNGLPGPNEPIDFDQGEPFMTKGLGPDGEFVSYYNFDVQPTEPAPIYVLFREGELTPVEGQHNIVDDIPGDDDYNDFWEVFKVTVPSNYVANTTTSALQITMEGYPMEETETIVNCPIVPEGSLAELRYNEEEDAGLTAGWYRGKIIYYFNFAEKALSVDAQDMVPLSPIYVTFNINPGEDGGGPPSGFKTEEGTGRAHNVVSTLPEDEGYSPLWRVNVYDNADFDNVHDLASAQAANILAMGVANVNCPIVLVEPATSVENTDKGIPDKYSLSQNYPNPFNPSTTIDFALVNNEYVSIKVYNSIGQQVVEVVNETLPAGNYSVNFDASSFSSGVYFYTISTKHFNQTKKMLLLK
jgi:hypothetical protein